jgi:hypothetical protein
MKHQHGATLIIILIVVLVITSITVLGFEMSMLEFKTTTQLQTNTLDFYRAENCLHTAMQKIYAANTPVHPHDYSLLDVRQRPTSWWQSNGDACGKNIFSYTQLLTEKTTDDYTFYRITVYGYPNQLLQVTIGKSFVQSLPILISWRHG